MDLTEGFSRCVGLADFEGRSQLRTWLFGICRRVASDYRRSSPIRREVVTDAAAMDLQRGEHEGPFVGTESRQRAGVAEAILNRLPEPQRVVFVLFELEEMSGEDIAALLNISVGTVRSRRPRWREKISAEVKRLAAMDSSGRRPSDDEIRNDCLDL
jgi:RNA polymerase sigma-70 factor (ECF subfamily)